MKWSLWFVVIILLTSPHAVGSDWHTPQGARHLVGQTAMICGNVGSARFAENTRGAPTSINLGPAFPDHVFTVVIWGSDRENFSFKPETLSGMLCVNGQVSEYRGIPQIVVTSPQQISGAQ